MTDWMLIPPALFFVVLALAFAAGLFTGVLLALGRPSNGKAGQ